MNTRKPFPFRIIEETSHTYNSPFPRIHSSDSEYYSSLKSIETKTAKNSTMGEVLQNLRGSYNSWLKKAREEKRDKERQLVLQRRIEDAHMVLDVLYTELLFVKHVCDIQDSRRARLAFAQRLCNKILCMERLEEDSDIFMLEFLEALDVNHASQLTPEYILDCEERGDLDDAANVCRSYLNDRRKSLGTCI